MSQTKKAVLKPGTTVGGRYRIEGTVGRGGFGAVYEATQTDSGRRVALKILLKNYGTSEKDTRRFRREAALVQKLRHPNVVELYDFGHTDRGQPYIAFELLRGGALGKLLKTHGALPANEVLRISRDVLSALEAAHGLGIIHRDIKPQNIFVCDDGSAKVLDFGIAKAVRGKESNATQLTETGQMLGTPQYMAPEQVRGADVVPSTDLYALGLLMAEMISGKRVVTGDAIIDIYMAHISDEPFDFEPLVLQSQLAPQIRRATQKEMAGRYADAGAMLADMPGSTAPTNDVDDPLMKTRAVEPRIFAQTPLSGQHTTAPIPLVPKSPPVATGSAASYSPISSVPPQHPSHGAPSSDPGFDPLNATVMMPEGEELDVTTFQPHAARSALPLDSATMVMQGDDYDAHLRKLHGQLPAQIDSSDIDSTLEMEDRAPPARASHPGAPQQPQVQHGDDRLRRHTPAPVSHAPRSREIQGVWGTPSSQPRAAQPQSPVTRPMSQAGAGAAPSAARASVAELPVSKALPLQLPNAHLSPHAAQARPGPHAAQPQAPHSGQPHSGQPHSGQPHSGQPHSGQPHSGQPHSGQPSSNQLGGRISPQPTSPRAPQHTHPDDDVDGGNLWVMVLLVLLVIAGVVGVLIWAPWDHAQREQDEVRPATRVVQAGAGSWRERA